MAVDDAFGQVGRAARVAHRGCRRLLERGPGIPGALGVQQLLVVDRARQAAAIAVAEHNQVLYCRQLAIAPGRPPLSPSPNTIRCFTVVSSPMTGARTGARLASMSSTVSCAWLTM